MPTPNRIAQPLFTILATSLIAALPAQRVRDAARYVGEGPVAERVAAIVDATDALGFQGAVLAAWNGEVVFAGGVGCADTASSEPNTANTLFEIASASKPWTAIAVCRLAQARKLDLDASIAEYLQGIPESCTRITVRHLLQHTSGIPGNNAGAGGDDLAAVLPVFLAGGPRHDPGTHWEYWNQGYALLAGILQQVGGDDFRDHMRKQVFDRAKLRSTFFTGDKAREGLVVATGVASRGPDRGALEHPYGSFGFQYRGMGGIVTNVWELWRLDRALHGDALLRRSMQEEMFRPGLRDYALGWFVRDVPAAPGADSGRRTHREQSHTGSVRGFLADVRRYPDDDGCVFVLCNRDDAPVVRVASMVSATLRGFEVAVPPRPLEQQLARGLEGVFRSEDQVEIMVRTRGVTTTFSVHWGDGVGPEGKQISHWILGAAKDGGERDVVAFDGKTCRVISLSTDDSGAVTGFRMGERDFARTL